MLLGNRLEYWLKFVLMLVNKINQHMILKWVIFLGTGNVLKIQKMLHYCNDHLDQEKPEDSTFQTFAVIGIAMIAMGEEIGSEMALRSFNHLVKQPLLYFYLF